MTTSTSCPLCNSNTLSLISQDERRRRPFHLCPDCAMISVPPQYHLSVQDELSRYALHDNTLSNKGYVDFLTEVADVAVSVASDISHRELSMEDPIEPPIKLLDFGCGKEAALCRLLELRGIDCYPYDPLYDGLRLPNVVDKYDIIVACEVIEHLRDIAGELRLMARLLRSGGAIILRTQLYDGAPDFQKWWYAQDPAHINFFSRKTMEKLASSIDKRLEETEHRDIFIVR
jgi:SAM-dependent methyltransferase